MTQTQKPNGSSNSLSSSLAKTTIDTHELNRQISTDGRDKVIENLAEQLQAVGIKPSEIEKHYARMAAEEGKVWTGVSGVFTVKNVLLAGVGVLGVVAAIKLVAWAFDLNVPYIHRAGGEGGEEIVIHTF